MVKRSKIEKLFLDFASPSPDYSPAPFFFLNLEMDQKIVREVLGELVKKGVRGAVLHPRTGLKIRFASSEFWRRLRAIVKEAKELGMVIWLYDDYNWPSGTAAGRVIDERPDFRAGGINFHYTSEYQRIENCLAVFKKVKGGRFELVREKGEGNKYLCADFERMTDTNFALSSAPWFLHSGRGSLDLMNPEATEMFLEIVYKGFERHLDKFFGDPIQGVFTDEPQNYRPFPWTEKFPERFKERFKYDIVENLPSLVEDVGEYITVRRNYYTLVRDLTHESYYKSLREWAERNGIKLTGHLGEEDFIEKLPQNHGSPFCHLLEMHIPGTDYLGAGHGYLKDEILSGHPNFNPKMASSISRVKRSDRTMCEIWGGAGWGHGPRTFKRSLDWAAAAGINLFVPHAVHVSLMGLRKRDFPPSHFIQQPYWEEYKIFADYISRLSLILSKGKRISDILVLFPLSSLWVETKGMGILTDHGKELAKSIEEVTDDLLNNQRDFDYLFENALELGLVRISRGAVVMGEMRYTTLIIPKTRYISDLVRSFVRRAKDAGVNILILGDTPDIIGSDKIFPVGDEIIGFDDVKELIGHIVRNKSPNIKITGRGSSKRSDSADFVCQYRRYSGADIYFLSYLGDEPFEVELLFKSLGNPEIWDPIKGVRYGVPDFEIVDNGIKVGSLFQPGESRIYVIHQETTSTFLGWDTPPKKKSGEFFMSKRWEVSYKKDNMFRIDKWRIISSSRNISFPGLLKLWRDARYPIYSKLIISLIRICVEIVGPFIGLKRKIKYRPFTNMEEDFKLTDLALRVFGLPREGLGLYQKFDLVKDAAMYSGIPLVVSMPPEGARYEISANFLIDEIPDRVNIIWEDIGEATEIYVNGHLITDKSHKFFLWDRSNRRAKIDDLLRIGKNRIGIKSRQPYFPTLPPALHWIEPVVITGDFDVDMGSLTKRRDTTTELRWGEEDTGNYSGTVTYRCRFKLPKRFCDRRAILHLGDVRETARVAVNGNDLGVRLWPPYDFEVTDFLNLEENVLEISVSNTAENLLGRPIPSGIMGDPRLVFYY